ncbi:MAG: IMP dehydrogenase [Planctomycetes bacterium]|nr:IMP dehydrogenase [Planctomycetota bacterium]
MRRLDERATDSDRRLPIAPGLVERDLRADGVNPVERPRKTRPSPLPSPRFPILPSSPDPGTPGATGESTVVEFLGEGLTYDDVLLVPQMASALPRDVVTATRFCRGVELQVPIVAAAMDTVTESRMAVALAQQGGIGIVHKNLSVDKQVGEVDKVKRSANGVIVDPVALSPDDTVGRAKDLMRDHKISGLPVVDGSRKVVGILTSRDLRFVDDRDARVSLVMTANNLVKAPPDTTLDQARQILKSNKVEKLILVGADGRLAGLITMKDIRGTEEFPNAARDPRGRLLVGAAVGVHDLERVGRLVEAGCDVVVVDTAHGHSKNVIDTVRAIKQQSDIPVVAGNVGTFDGAKALVDAGADGVKVGIGPGSICTTRIVTGCGVPQLTAVLEAVKACAPAGVPVIADGGIRQSGDIVKALAAGASSVMLGSLLAGLEESPGETILYRGRQFKTVRGMGSLGAMEQGSADRYAQAEVTDKQKFVPEGVEGMVPYKGLVADFIYQLAGGLRSGMGYCGARTLAELTAKSQFLRVTPAGLRESHPHDIQITKEAPNYTGEA